ncbi:hypothetical protein J2S68_004060 [Glycomyces algeriensis]|nr:hypothetical protein [Glycomyces algeriensis]
MHRRLSVELAAAQVTGSRGAETGGWRGDIDPPGTI